MPQEELGSIPEQIHAEAVRQSQQQLERARRVAERHIAAAKAKVEEMERRLQEDLGLVLKHEVERAVARAKMEARNRKLLFREKILSEAADAAISKLAGISRDEAYERLLVNLILEGVRELGTRRARLSLNKEDSRLFGESARLAKLEEALTRELGEKTSVEVSPEPIDCSGGVVVGTQNGRVSYYNTFEEILGRRKDEIRSEVERKVFEEKDG